jgi:hypothetical protein
MILIMIFILSALTITVFIAGMKFGDKKGIPTIQKFDVWAICVIKTEKPLHQLDKSWLEHELKAPAITAEDVTDLNALFVADPFLIHEKELCYMFFEVLDKSTMKGKIGLAKSRDGKVWEYDQIVLEEPYHLSYPYVFHWNDSIYMIPEANQSRSIRLYKTSDFPYQWDHCATLLNDDNYTDVSLFFWNDRWWLFTTTVKRLNNNLRLFSSYDLMGEWSEHPMSPIIEGDASIARPAGRIYQNGKELFRYSQDCSDIYGKSVSGFQIVELTENNYLEQEYSFNPILYPGISDWNQKGMHHIDSVKISKDQWIHAVDGHKEIKLAGFKKNGIIRIIERNWVQNIVGRI